ncbi:MAG: hypothetical protein JW862_09525 [Anaerolineales bacterium]|nr:hypothetical protein [Anaerolineales bacterium]
MNAIQAYKHYYIDRDYEQVDLFRLVNNSYDIGKVIYPGSYIHIAPSFIYSDVVYIDSDTKAKKYFHSNELNFLVNERKEYIEDPKITFLGVSYETPLKEFHASFDLMISQYAGFISYTCKDYLRIGGYLLVNNSHGDAGLAAIDEDYQLISIVQKTRGKYRLSSTLLEKYFIPKQNILYTKDLLIKIGKGVGYTKTAPLYVFKRIS